MSENFGRLIFWGSGVAKVRAEEGSVDRPLAVAKVRTEKNSRVEAVFATLSCVCSLGLCWWRTRADEDERGFSPELENKAQYLVEENNFIPVRVRPRSGPPRLQLWRKIIYHCSGLVFPEATGSLNDAALYYTSTRCSPGRDSRAWSGSWC